MGGISLSVHPLFFVFGLYYAGTGKIFVFLVYTICAVMRELGHSFVASNAGYRLNKITLMPFGAVVKGDIEGLKLSDEIKVALAGPLLNLAVGLFFVATWWIYPESYAFTDIVAEANFSLAMVNFLPIFPLDGGRVVSAILTQKFGEKKSSIICKILGGVFAGLLLALFIVTIFNTINLSLLFFALFVTFGAFGKGKENRYVKAYSTLSENNLMRGVPIKRTAVSKNVTVKKLLALIDENAVNEIIVYDKNTQIAVLSQQKIEKIIENGDIYSTIEKFLGV
jgi:stage IV sporulation protein FB